MRPEEHDLTFSWLNTYVIQTGVIFLLITDATGPLYGNGQYIFSSGELPCSSLALDVAQICPISQTERSNSERSLRP
jgi:hypothetical protein